MRLQRRILRSLLGGTWACICLFLLCSEGVALSADGCQYAIREGLLSFILTYFLFRRDLADFHRMDEQDACSVDPGSKRRGRRSSPATKSEKVEQAADM